MFHFGPKKKKKIPVAQKNNTKYQKNQPVTKKRNWLAWSRLRQKSGHFLPDEADFCRP